MNRPLVVSTFAGLVLTMWLLAWSVFGSAERLTGSAPEGGNGAADQAVTESLR